MFDYSYFISREQLTFKVEWLMSDGTRIDTSSSDNGKVVIARVTGSCRHILQGERTALNVISRCSGVATATSEAVQQAKALGWKGYVAGTRKTTPGAMSYQQHPHGMNDFPGSFRKTA